MIQSDLEVLTALNRDYVQSVQDGDVRRFDEILAEDFLCSNPDGSLVDKKQFLAQTARPVTISGLSAQEVLGQDLLEPLHIAMLHRVDVVEVEHGQRVKVASRGCVGLHLPLHGA